MLGEHGYGAVDEVDAGGTFLGLAVDDVALLHVVAHVGDVYADLPAVAHGAYGECVVEVLGIVGVDGECGDGAEVLAAGNLLGGDAGVNLVGYTLHLFGVGIGQSVFRQDGMHLGVVLALVAEDVHHFSGGALCLFGPVGNLHHHLLSVLGPFHTAFGDEDVGGERAVGEYEGIVALHLYLSDEGVLGTFHDFDDLRLTCVCASACQHRHSYAVAVEGMARIPFADEYFLAAVVGDEHVVAVALLAENALDDLAATGLVYVGSVAVGGEIVVEDEVRKTLYDDHFGRMLYGTDGRKDVLDVQRLVFALLEEAEQAVHHLAFALAVVFLCHDCSCFLCGRTFVEYSLPADGGTMSPSLGLRGSRRMLTSPPPSLCLPRQSRESFFDFPASSACFSCRCKVYSALQSYGKKRKPAVSKAPFVMFFVCSSSFFHRMALLCAVCRSAMFRATAHFLSITTGMFHYFA